MTVEQLIFLLLGKPRKDQVYIKGSNGVVVPISGLGLVLDGGENYSPCFWSITIDAEENKSAESSSK